MCELGKKSIKQKFYMENLYQILNFKCFGAALELNLKKMHESRCRSRGTIFPSPNLLDEVARSFSNPDRRTEVQKDRKGQVLSQVPRLKILDNFKICRASFSAFLNNLTK